MPAKGTLDGGELDSSDLSKGVLSAAVLNSGGFGAWVDVVEELGVAFVIFNNN